VTSRGSVLPGVDNAGLWRVCYENPAVPGLLREDGASLTLEDVAALSEPDVVVGEVVIQRVADAPASASSPRAPRRAAEATDPAATSADGPDRVINASKVAADIREDFEENLPWSASAAEGCTSDVSLYEDLWGRDAYPRLNAVRGLTLAFLFCAALKVLGVLLAKACCCDDGGERGGAGVGGAPVGLLTLVQVLAGWAGWLVYLWILADLARAGGEHEAAAASGIPIDVDAAGKMANYWGHSFWLFLAATLASTLGAAFGCC